MADVLQIKVEGLETIDALTKRIDDDLNIDKILDEGAAIIFNRIRTRFLEARGPDGEAWIESGAAKKRAEKGIGGLTGYDTGNLFRSLQLYKDSDWERAIGTDVPYAPFFQYGPPARIYLGFADEDTTTMEQLVKLRITEALNG